MEPQALPADSWDAQAFAAAVRRAGVSFAAVRRELAARGYGYSAEAVRGWGRPGSRGPKHAATREALAAVVERLSAGADSE